jgi:hypothetical protein
MTCTSASNLFKSSASRFYISSLATCRDQADYSHKSGREPVKALSEDVAKQNIFTTIANAFRALARAIAAAAARRAGGGAPISRATKFFSNGKQPNLKNPGESKLSRAEQKDKAKEISQNKNWKKCLRGEKPEK